MLCQTTRSHAMSARLDSDAPAMAVFEDDVRLLPQLPQALAAIEALPADGSWDMIKLYGREPEKIANQGPLVAGALQLIS